MKWTRCGSTAVEALSDLLLRAELGWASGEGADRAMALLREIAESVLEDDALRGSAMVGLSVADAPWIDELIEESYQSDVTALRLASLQAMGRSANVSWLPMLEDSLDVEDEDERLSAVQAMGEIGSEDAAPLLVELFEDATATEELLQAAVSGAGRHRRRRGDGGVGAAAHAS